MTAAAENGGGMGTAWRWVASAPRRYPATAALLVAVWVLTALAGVLGDRADLFDLVGTGPAQLQDGRAWTLLTSGWVAASWPRLVLLTPVFAAAGAVLERRLGVRWLLTLVTVTQLGGAAVGCLLAWGISAVIPTTTWGAVLSAQVAVAAAPWMLGTTVAAAAVLDSLWRRRVRAVVLTLAWTVVLFTGQLTDLMLLGGVATGLLLGRALPGRPRHSPLVGGTVREIRTLVALVVAAAVLGSVAVAFNANSAGPLWPLSQLFLDPGITPADAADACAEDRGSADCRSALQAVRLSGVGSAIMTLLPMASVLLAAGALRRGLRAAHVGVVTVVSVLVAGSVVLVVAEDTPLAVVDGDETTFGVAPADPVLWLVGPSIAIAGLALLLVAAAPYFTARLPRRTITRAALLVAGIVAAGGVAYVLAGLALYEGFDRYPSLADLALDYPPRLLPPVFLAALDPQLLAVSEANRFLQAWIGVFVAVPCLGVAWWALRSAPEGRDDAELGRVRELLRSPGGTTLSWWATWPGNHYWFDEMGDAGAGGAAGSVVAYRVRSGIALTTGEPIGPVAERERVALDFAEFCAEQGWTPCFYSVGRQLRDALTAHGFSSVQVAEETVIRLPDLAFRGKKFQDVRTALNRAGKEGVRAEWTTMRSAPLGVAEQIVAISEEWVADKGMPEMGFTLGGIDELADDEVRLLVALDDDGHVHGVTSWLPVYAGGEPVGMTLDFMRRRAGGFRPVMEFLIASAALHAQQEGLQVLSLSGAPLAHAGAGAAVPAADADGPASGGDASTLDGVLDRLGRSLEPVYGFRSLLGFKAKFQPEYRPLYLCHPDAAALPAIGVAVARAYLPSVEWAQGTRLVRKVLRRDPS